MNTKSETKSASQQLGKSEKRSASTGSQSSAAEELHQKRVEAGRKGGEARAKNRREKAEASSRSAAAESTRKKRTEASPKGAEARVKKEEKAHA